MLENCSTCTHVERLGPAVETDGQEAGGYCPDCPTAFHSGLRWVSVPYVNLILPRPCHAFHSSSLCIRLAAPRRDFLRITGHLSTLSKHQTLLTDRFPEDREVESYENATSAIVRDTVLGVEVQEGNRGITRRPTLVGVILAKKRKGVASSLWKVHAPHW